MTDVTPVALHLKLANCPICGSPPRRERRKGAGSVVCYAGSHSLRINADDQRQADRQWNDMARDWADRQDAAVQFDQSLSIIDAIARIEHYAGRFDNGLNSGAAALRNSARILRAHCATASSLAAENARLRTALAEASGSLCTAYCSHNAITGDLIQHRVQCTRLTAALQGE